MNANADTIRSTAIAAVSLLDEPASGGAIARTFRERPVLAHTVERVAKAAGLDRVTVLAWDDQLADLATIELGRAEVRAVGPRKPSPAMLARAAALRWSDGWRGGLLGTTEFDRGFDADALVAALDSASASVAILVAPSAALIEPAILEELLARLNGPAAAHGYAFVAGTPGSGAFALTRETLDRLRRDKAAPGALLNYHPDRAQHDPIAREACVPVPAVVARSLARLSVDSSRQVARLALAQADRPNLAAESRLTRLATHETIDAMPREVVVELTTRRATRPVWSLPSRYAVDRPVMTTERAKAIFGELAAVDDVRVTLAGVGDPLAHPEVPEILAIARAAGINAIHVETELLPESPEMFAALVAHADVCSILLPAMTRRTYATAMNADRLDDVLANVRSLLIARAGRGGALPILVPTFHKLELNIGEMEAWYDQWIRAVGTAAIVGPSDFGGVIPFAGVADMTPPHRIACRQLRSRLAVLSDGTIVACEQDLLGRRAIGRVGEMDLATAWTDGIAPMRAAHARGDWKAAGPTCEACRMWDRP